MRNKAGSITDHGVGHPRLEVETANAERIERQRFQHGDGLAGKGFLVELVEDHDATLRNARKKQLKRQLRRTVDVEVQIQEAHNKIRVILQVLRGGNLEVTSD